MEYKIWNVGLPLAVHFLVIQLLAVVGSGFLDAAARTAFAALITFPVFWNWYQQDQRLWKRKKKTAVWYELLITVVLAVLMNQALSWLISVLLLPAGASNAVQEELLDSSVLMQVIGMGIFVPVTEEVLFRGLVYGRLQRYLSRLGAVLAGAALFALYHGNLVQAAFAFPMGIVLCLLYRYGGGLCLPILFHAASNLSTILMNVLLS